MGPQLCQVHALGSLDLVGGVTSAALLAFCPMRVKRWGVIITTAVAGGPVVLGMRVQRANASTTVVPAQPGVAPYFGGTITLPASVAVNQGYWTEVDVQVGPRVIYPCEGVHFLLEVPAATTGIAQCFVVTEMLGFNNQDQRDYIPNHPSSTTVRTPFDDMTKVTA